LDEPATPFLDLLRVLFARLPHVENFFAAEPGAIGPEWIPND
jgi:hypothetical protein